MPQIYPKKLKLNEANDNSQCYIRLNIITLISQHDKIDKKSKKLNGGLKLTIKNLL